MLRQPPSLRGRWVPISDTQPCHGWPTGATQAMLLCHRGTKEGPELGLAGLLGSGKWVRTFQRGGRRAWAGCGSSALATQLSPRCTFFSQRPGTSHVKASQRLGGSELCSGKWRCTMSIPLVGTALPPGPFNRE